MTEPQELFAPRRRRALATAVLHVARRPATTEERLERRPHRPIGFLHADGADDRKGWSR